MTKTSQDSEAELKIMTKTSKSHQGDARKSIEAEDPEWNEPLQSAAASMRRALILEIALSKIALRDRFRDEWNWISSWSKNIAPGSDRWYVSPIAILIATAIIGFHEFYYYSRFSFSIIPFLLEESINPNSLGILALTFLILLLICSAGLYIFGKLLGSLALFPIYVRGICHMIQWKYRTEREAKKIIKWMDRLKRYVDRDLAITRPLILTRSRKISRINSYSISSGIKNNSSLRLSNLDVGNDFGDYRRKIRTGFKRTLRFLCLAFPVIGLFFLGYVQKSCQFNEFLEGRNSVIVLTDPPMLQSDRIRRVGSWGSYLFVTQVHETDQLLVVDPQCKQEECDFVSWLLNTSVGRYLRPDRSTFSLQSPVTAINKDKIVCIELSTDDSPLCRDSLPVGAKGEFEALVKKELRSEAECAGRVPEELGVVRFRRDQSLSVSDPSELEMVLARLERWRGRDLYVFGLASGDGDSTYNRELALKRANYIASRIVVKPERELAIWTRAVGEDHLSQGVANSRSVRIVGCGDSE